MNRVTMAGVTVVALAAAAVGGVAFLKPELLALRPGGLAPAAVEEKSKALYYQHPDGLAEYSLAPKKAPDGRDYRAVPQGTDTSFDDKDDSPEAGAAAKDRKIKYYRNPMGLPDTSPVPKKDSMGMDYIAVHDGEDSDDGAIKLSPGKIQRTGVKSEPAAMRVLRTTIRAPGTVQLDERRIAVISMRAEGWLQKVENVTTGTTVSKGQPLFHLYSPAIVGAAADYVALMTSSGMPKSNEGLGRGSRQRLMNFDLPESVIKEIETSRNVPLSVVWSAPRDGIVLERNAVEGMRVQPGDVLFRLADASVVWIMADVAERDLGMLAIGQPVTVRARAYPGRVFSGKLDVIYPQLNRDTRTARLRIELANPDLALLPDMYVDTDIATGSQEPVLTVAENSVIDTGAKQAVFVDKGEGRLEPRDVKVGRRGGGFVEIRDGIADGEPVVVAANFLIDAESNLKAALKGFSGAGANP